MLNRILVCTCFSGLLAVAAPLSLAKEPLRNRRAFAEAMNRVREGMSEAEVIALVGKPDELRASEIWEGPGPPPIRGWRYGGSHQIATLGEVIFDENQRVSFVTGQGTPPPDGLFTELELRSLLEVIHDSADPDGHYNPRKVIRAVNLLQPLGKEKALAAVAEFLRVSSDYIETGTWNAVPLMLRTLFEVPTVETAFSLTGEDDRLPPGTLPAIFGASAPESANLKLLPRYPIVIEGDIPFLIESWHGTTGPGPVPELHLAYFRKYGRLRDKPLAPTPKPFEALDKFMKSPRWCFNKSNRVPHNEQEQRQEADQQQINERQLMHLRNQVLRLLDTVHHFEPEERDVYLAVCCCCDTAEKKLVETENQRIVAAASKLAIRWDNKQSRYTFLDGKSVEPFDPTNHPAQSWTPAVPDLRFRVVPDLRFRVERESRQSIVITAEVRYPHSIRGVVVRVFDVKVKSKPLFDSNQLPDREKMRLEEGSEIQVELTVGKQTLRSPVLKP